MLQKLLDDTFVAKVSGLGGVLLLLEPRGEVIADRRVRQHMAAFLDHFRHRSFNDAAGPVRRERLFARLASGVSHSLADDLRLRLVAGSRGPEMLFPVRAAEGAK